MVELDDHEEYQLKSRPGEETHLEHCAETILVMRQINDKIKQEPAGSMTEIYNECLESYCDTMDPQARTSFLENFPKLDKIEANLVQSRHGSDHPELPSQRRKNTILMTFSM